MKNITVGANAMPKPRRRRFQFSLRTLFVMMTLIAIGGGWFAMRLTKARRQEAAVQALLSMGASVCYDYEMERNDGKVNYSFVYEGPAGTTNSPATLHDQAPSSPWLRERLGVDFLHRVVGVRAERMVTATKIIAELKHLPDLVDVHIESYAHRIKFWQMSHRERVRVLETEDRDPESIRPLTIRDLAVLPQLKCLVLDGCYAVQDDDLAALGRMQNLEELTIRFSENAPGQVVAGISGARKLSTLRLGPIDLNEVDLELLRDLPELARIEIIGSVCNAAALGGLRHLPKLSELTICGEIGGGDFTAEQIADLGNLPALRRLSITYTNDDREPKAPEYIARHSDPKTVAFVRHLRGLEELELKSNSRLGDLSILDIAQATNLRRINLEGCRVSSSGLAPLTALTKLERLSIDMGLLIDETARQFLPQLNARGNLTVRNAHVLMIKLDFLTGPLDKNGKQQGPQLPAFVKDLVRTCCGFRD